MTISINGKDLSKMMGVTVYRTEETIEITATRAALERLRPDDKSLVTDLALKLVKEKDGQVKAKAELEFVDAATASIDQDGKIETGLHVKF